jgi:tetratricopeptide (TPR) repeat protein
MKYPVQAARILGGSLREKLREDIRDDAIPEVIQIATKAALGIELPLLATAAKFGRQAAEVSAQALRARRMLHSSENLSSPSEHLAVDARSLANEIRRLSKAGMPVIIAIDDLQDAHPEIFALLDSLLSADRVDDAPILVVATTTTEAFRTPGMLRNEYAWLEDRHRTHLVTLPAFGEAEMIQLLRQVAPRTADSQARRVVRHCGSPLVLWALLLSGGFQKYRRHPNIVGDAVVISDDELHELPFSISSLIRHRWDEIPARTRDILMLCAFASPIGQEAGDHIIWHDDVIEELLQVLDLGLDNGHTLIRESGLVRSCGEGVSTFADPSLADVALNASREVFAERRSSIRRTIARSVDRRLNEVWEGFDCVSLGLEYLDGFSKGDEPLVSGEWRDRVVVARLTLCFEVGDHESILKIAEEFDNKGWPGSIGLYVRAKSVLLDSLIEVGRIPQAFNLAVALINEGVVAEPYTPDMPDDKLVLDLRIAQIIGENGQPEYAVLALQNLLEAMTRHGATPEELASVHNALAIWLSETGQAEEALRHYDLALSSASPSSTDGLVVRQKPRSYFGADGTSRGRNSRVRRSGDQES